MRLENVQLVRKWMSVSISNSQSVSKSARPPSSQPVVGQPVNQFANCQPNIQWVVSQSFNSTTQPAWQSVSKVSDSLSVVGHSVNQSTNPPANYLVGCWWVSQSIQPLSKLVKQSVSKVSDSLSVVSQCPSVSQSACQFQSISQYIS